MHALRWLMNHYTLTAAWLTVIVVTYAWCGAVVASGVGILTAFAFSFGWQHAQASCSDCHR